MTSDTKRIEYTRKNIPSKVGTAGIALLLIGIVIAVTAYIVDPVRSAYNNIMLLMFVTSVGLGSLFLVAVEYLGGAVWSVPFRRVFEFLSAIVVIVPVIALPLFFNMSEVFHWANHSVEHDAIMRGKEPFLNMSFFTIREFAFYLIWVLFYFLIVKNSLKQDNSGDQKFTRKNTKLAAIFMPLFAITITFTAIDWMMSLEAHWFSTIYGVYYFSGTILCALAVGTIIIVKMSQNGYLVKGILSDHYYSLGALLFAFVNFWAYIAFSQYMLIWYANLPEETFWFLMRWDGPWVYVSIFLILMHFAVPYFGLLSQPSKMNPKRLVFISAWIIVAHIVDLYWLIFPTYNREGVTFGWMELGYPLIAAGIILLVFNLNAKKRNYVAIGDPKMKRALNFRL